MTSSVKQALAVQQQKRNHIPQQVQDRWRQPLAMAEGVGVMAPRIDAKMLVVWASADGTALWLSRNKASRPILLLGEDERLLRVGVVAQLLHRHDGHLSEEPPQMGQEREVVDAPAAHDDLGHLRARHDEIHVRLVDGVRHSAVSVARMSMPRLFPLARRSGRT